MLITYRDHKKLDSFEILKLTSPHTCTHAFVKQDHCQLDLRFITTMVSIVVMVMVFVVLTCYVIINIVTIQIVVLELRQQ